MKLPFNMDRSKKIVIQEGQVHWTSSPHPNVFRKQFEREKEESGEATSLVRYAENSHFSEHSHPLGEEIFVLDGEFADENGRYPAGTYIRNPPGSRHKPFSELGCKLFVKLNQFHPEDLERQVIETPEMEWRPGFDQLRVKPLHEFQGLSTALVHWPKGAQFQTHRHWGGEEIFVLEGVFEDEFGTYPKGTWIRNPHLSSHHPFSTEGCTILVKVGHLHPASTSNSNERSRVS